MLNFFFNLGKVALYAVLAAGVLLSFAFIVGALLFNIDGEVVITWFSLVFIGFLEKMLTKQPAQPV